jgi:hypothetical protein
VSVLRCGTADLHGSKLSLGFRSDMLNDKKG